MLRIEHVIDEIPTEAGLPWQYTRKQAEISFASCATSSKIPSSAFYFLLETKSIVKKNGYQYQTCTCKDSNWQYMFRLCFLFKKTLGLLKLLKASLYDNLTVRTGLRS